MVADSIARLGSLSKTARRLAADELIAQVRVDDRAAAAVVDALTDGNAHRRWGATFVLYRTGKDEDRVYDGALEALGSDDGDVRWAAAEITVALARRDEQRRGRLDAIARTDGSPARKMALYCLRDLGAGNESIYGAALADTRRDVRLAGIAGLARLAALTPTGGEALAAVMESDLDAGVRRAAAVALGAFAGDGTPARSALERLRDATVDRDLARAIDRALAHGKREGAA